MLNSTEHELSTAHKCKILKNIYFNLLSNSQMLPGSPIALKQVLQQKLSLQISLFTAFILRYVIKHKQGQLK